MAGTDDLLLCASTLSKQWGIWPLVACEHARSSFLSASNQWCAWGSAHTPGPACSSHRSCMGPSWIDSALYEGARAVSQGLVTSLSVPKCPAVPSCPSLSCSTCATCPSCPAANCTCVCPSSPSPDSHSELWFLCVLLVFGIGLCLGGASQWLCCSVRQAPKRHNGDSEDDRETVQARVRARRKLG
jgi:hypothetical protein